MSFHQFYEIAVNWMAKIAPIAFLTLLGLAFAANITKLFLKRQLDEIEKRYESAKLAHHDYSDQFEIVELGFSDLHKDLNDLEGDVRAKLEQMRQEATSDFINELNSYLKIIDDRRKNLDALAAVDFAESKQRYLELEKMLANRKEEIRLNREYLDGLSAKDTLITTIYSAAKRLAEYLSNAGDGDAKATLKRETSK